jgi:hypothetical protein
LWAYDRHNFPMLLNAIPFVRVVGVMRCVLCPAHVNFLRAQLDYLVVALCYYWLPFELEPSVLAKIQI